MIADAIARIKSEVTRVAVIALFSPCVFNQFRRKRKELLIIERKLFLKGRAQSPETTTEQWKRVSAENKELFCRGRLNAA